MKSTSIYRNSVPRPCGKYLVANQTLPYDRIVAVGYGSMRPLASNETADGRAINRRIDVIVKP